MKKNIAPIIVFVLLVSSSLATAKNLLVSVQGSGSTCSREQPCGSIQVAIDIAEAGDRIKIQSGKYIENITIPIAKEGLVIEGSKRRRTLLVSAGGQEGKELPIGTPADIIVDIFAPNVVLKYLTIRHPEGEVTKHDIGIFVRPPANNVMLRNLRIQRFRTGDVLEPTVPGSRGVVIIRATGAVIKFNRFKGNYEDHLHVPSSRALILRNQLMGATRDGIAIVQEPPLADGSLPQTVGNIIVGNWIMNSGDEGIEVQGDTTLIMHNVIKNNIGHGILLCGEHSDCDFPRGVPADARENSLYGNHFLNNGEQNTLNEGSDNITFMSESF
jgi:nitrous oxidase accessory protein NosD